MNVQEWMNGWSRQPETARRAPQPVRAQVPAPPPGERRRHFRKDMALPARVRLRDASGVLTDSFARTRDISMGGTCVQADLAVPAGAVVEVEFLQQGLTFRSGATVVGVAPGELRLEFTQLSVISKDVLSMLLTGGLMLSAAM